MSLAIRTITQKKADAYDSFFEVFFHLYKELKILGNKKPAETLSERKVNIVNRLLEDIREVLKDETEFKYLDLLDNEALPQYSDAILILSQYEGALKGLRGRCYGWNEVEYENTWNIKG